MKDITILIPAIRTPLWLNLVESLKLACKKYTWEVLFVGPFPPPQEWIDKGIARYVSCNSNVTSSVQFAVPHISSPLFFLTVDDCTFTEDSIDKGIDLYKEKCTEKDVVSMIYGEGGNKMDPKYWTVDFHWGHFQRFQPGIDRGWKLANQPLMSKKRFIELGGYDCQFEYMDSAVHDFMFRNQMDGGQIYINEHHSCIASWSPGHEGDHGPIHDAQTTHDEPIFIDLYRHPPRQIKIPYEFLNNIPPKWTRRFPGDMPTSYEELCAMNGYQNKYAS